MVYIYSLDEKLNEYVYFKVLYYANLLKINMVYIQDIRLLIKTYILSNSSLFHFIMIVYYYCIYYSFYFFYIPITIGC